MKIVYIGNRDSLAEAFIEKMNKEGNDTYFLSEKDFSGKLSAVFRHRFYKISGKADMLTTIIESISPDHIVFGGNYLMDSGDNSEAERDIRLLSQVLECTAGILQGKFIYLSSCDVYGSSSEPVTEESKKRPLTKKGMIYDRGEYLVQLYQQRYGLNTVIIRTTQLYSNKCTSNSEDFLSRSFREAGRSEKAGIENEVWQPVHVQDFVEAVRVIIESGKQRIYNVAGSFELTKEELYNEINRMQNGKQVFSWNEGLEKIQIDNSRIKKELEWTDFRQLLKLLESGQIEYKEEKQKIKTKDKKKVSNGVRRLLENIIVFIVFFLIYYMSDSHNLVSKVDWLLIYVMLISLFFGIRQSALAVLLASAGFLYCKNLSILEMTNFYLVLVYNYGHGKLNIL